MTAPEPTHQRLQVEIRDDPAQDYLGIELQAPTAEIGRSVASAYGRLFAHLGQRGVQPAGPPFLIASPPAAGSMRVLAGVPTPSAVEGSGELRPGQLAGGRAAVCLYRGPYDQLGPVYEELAAWLRSHGLVPAGPPREVYLNGPADVTGPEDYLTQLVWPIR